MASLLVTGAIFMQIYDLFVLINQSDITKISFFILAVFTVFTVRIGILTYRPDAVLQSKLQVIRFVCDNAIFFLLGMIGTVFGFIYMLHTCFMNIDPSNISSMQIALVKMDVDVRMGSL